MNNNVYRLLITYLYQFWLFAFKTAKHWGHGPLDWTCDLLEFDRFKDKDHPAHSSSNTPRSTVGTPAHVGTPRSQGSAGYLAHINNHPSPLCRWVIHAAFRTRFEGEEKLNDYPEDYIVRPDGEES